MNEVKKKLQPGPHQLEFFPINIFAITMGLGGFAIATHRLEREFGLTNFLSKSAVLVTVVIFALLGGLYLVKALRYPSAVKAEWSHPITISFFPTITISLIILATCFAPHAQTVSAILWWIGAPLNIAATFAVVSTWINAQHYETTHLNPAWFIPVVGNVLAPVAGIVHAPLEFNWFLFSVGLLFWIVLLVIVFNRLVFHHPLPGKLLPTLFILVAPPALAYLSYMALNGGVLDGFARLLYSTAIFFFILMVLQARKLFKLDFSLSWWAYSFPLAALTIATFNHARTIQAQSLTWFAMGLYALLLMTIATLLIRTLVTVKNRQICIPG